LFDSIVRNLQEFPFLFISIFSVAKKRRGFVLKVFYSLRGQWLGLRKLEKK